MNVHVESAEDPSGDAPPANWREAMADLVSARLALMELEARDLARGATRKGLAVGVLAAAAFFTWALLLAGGIALLAAEFSLPWSWLALGAAGIHLVIALIAFAKLRQPGAPSFAITRSEFQRDREWFKKL